MMKKKMGFGLGHLRIASKPSNRQYDTDDAWLDGDDDEAEYISHVDTPFICRPPKLDARTERDLRSACAIILENLKPSGYDIEDTRMKSDILVNNTELQQKYLSSQPRSHRPQVAAPWSAGGEVDQSSSFVDSRRIIRDLEKRERRTKETYRSEPLSAASSTYPPHPLQSQPTGRSLGVESPLAPVSTIIQPTPIKPHSSQNRSIAARRAESSSTVSSVNPASNYDARSEVTDLTSAALTSSPGSKRVSDNDDDNTKMTSTDSKTREWMKDTVSKRIKAENALDPPKQSTESSNTHQSSSPSTKKSWALFSKYDKKPPMAEMKPVVNGHATKVSIFRPKSSGESRSQLTEGRQSTEQINAKRFDNKSPSSERPGSSGSMRSHLSILKNSRLTEISQDVPQSPRLRKEHIPPVPAITRFKESNSMSGDGDRRSPSLLTSFNQALPKLDLDFSTTETSRNGPALLPESASWVSEDPTTTADNTIIAPRIIRQDISVSASIEHLTPILTSPRANLIGSVPSSKKLARPADPEPADFDSLMGLMQDKAGTSELLVAGFDLPPQSKVQTPQSATRILTGQSKLSPKPTSSTKMSSESNRPNTTTTTNRANGNHFIITNHSRTHTSSGLPPNSRLNTDPAAAHFLYGPGGIQLKSESRGMKGFFKRLGGNEVRNVYVPARDPYRKYNDEKSDDEEDWDEEACAAPVVGFGRGW